MKLLRKRVKVVPLDGQTAMVYWGKGFEEGAMIPVYPYDEGEVREAIRVKLGWNPVIIRGGAM
jgi:hypothetical protein